jgi:hypothetical protein
MLLFGFIGGFFTGTWAIKRAMTGPGWVQWAFGIKNSPPPAPPAAPNQPVANTPVAQPGNVNSQIPAAAPQSPAPVSPGTGTGTQAGSNPTTGTQANTNPPNGSPNPPVNPSGSGGTASPGLADEKAFLGSWEIVDELKSGGNASGKVTSAYTFLPDGTGEFDTNNKKMYDLHWQTDQDFLEVTFDTDSSQSGKKWISKFRWSVDGSKTILTLVSEGEKDARAVLYDTTGPGVYHHKQ